MDDTIRLPADDLVMWRTFLTAHAAVINAIERDLAAAQCLPLTSYDVLLALVEAPDHRLRMHELARAVVLSRSGLSRLVDRLEREGLLTRERTASDRRGAYAILTETGRAALRLAWPVYARGIQTHFARHVQPSDVARLTNALQRVLTANLKKMP